MRRIVGSIILAAYSRPEDNIIAVAPLPFQLGVAVKGGVGIMFNLIRLATAAHPEVSWMVLGTDLKSAFQRMPRAHFLDKLRTHPTLYPLFFFAANCYLFPSTSVCFYGELFKYLSEEGMAQGCPSGSFCWAVGLDPILRAVAYVCALPLPLSSLLPSVPAFVGCVVVLVRGTAA